MGCSKYRPRETSCIDCGDVFMKMNGAHVRCAKCAAIRKSELQKQSYFWRKLRQAAQADTAESTANCKRYEVRTETLQDAVRHADALGVSYGHYMAMPDYEKRKKLQNLQQKKKPRTGGNRKRGKGK